MRRIIASGGTGQHVINAYLDLLILLEGLTFSKDIPSMIGEIKQLKQGQGILPYVYIFDSDLGGDEFSDKKSASQILSSKKEYLNLEIILLNPYPSLSKTNIDTIDILFKDSPIKNIIFNERQRAVRFKDGNFGHPAVASAMLYAKFLDTNEKDTFSINNDTNFQRLQNDIKNQTEQRIAHVGSSIGGTGSGVMPSLLSYLFKLQNKNSHFIIPFLEWFNLVGQSDDNPKAECRNITIKKNRSSGLNFYLKQISNIAAVMPLGHKSLNDRMFLREWAGDFAQPYKADILHYVSAISIYNYFSSDYAWHPGMYSFVAEENNMLSKDTKIGNYSLKSILDANTKLISEGFKICSYFRNPLNFGNFLEITKNKVIIKCLANLSREDLISLSEKIRTKLNLRNNILKNICSLAMLDNVIQYNLNDKINSYYEVKNILDEIKPFESEIDINQIADAIIATLIERSRKLVDEPQKRLSTKRFIPEYAFSGVAWQNKNIGEVVKEENLDYFKKLYSRKNISAENIPSPSCNLHYLKNICFNDIVGDDEASEDEKEWIDKYITILRAIVSGKINIEKYKIFNDEYYKNLSKIKYPLERILINIPKEDDSSWSTYKNSNIFLLKYSFEKEHHILGLSNPETLIIPSPNLKKEIWNDLKNEIQQNDEKDLRILKHWVNTIAQADNHSTSERPLWFIFLQKLLGKTRADQDYIALENPFNVFWVDNYKSISIPKIPFGYENRSKQNWDKISAEICAEKILYFKNKKLWIDNEHKSEAKDSDEKLLKKISLIINKENSFKNVLFYKDKISRNIDLQEKILLWEDIVKRNINDDNILIFSEEGELQIVFKKEKTKIFFDKNEYHGLSLENMSISSMYPFRIKGDSITYPEIPIKFMYTPLVEKVQGPPDRILRYEKGWINIRFRVKFVGRNDEVTIDLPLITAIDKEELNEGQIFIWPKIKTEKWKSYFGFITGNERFKKHTFHIAMVNSIEEDPRKKFRIVTKFDTSRTHVDLIDREDDKGTSYKPLLVGIYNDKNEENGSFEIYNKLENRYFDSGNEIWGIDFGTSTSMVAYNGKILDLQEDNTLKILSFEEDNKQDWSNEGIIERGKWFPNFTKSRKIDDKSLPTELFYHSNFNINQNFKNTALPVIDFQIPSNRLSVKHIVRENWIENFKWTQLDQNTQEFYTKIRSDYLYMLMLIATADRLSKTNLSTNIKPRFTFPLRLRMEDRINFKNVCEKTIRMIKDSTGIDFDEPEFLSESHAVASPGEYSFVADLGGATLDLWIGNSADTRNDEMQNWDSIKIGGFLLLTYLIENKKKEIMTIVEKDNEQNLEYSLRRTIVNRISFEEIFRKKLQQETQEIYMGYFSLISEYCSRFICGYINKYKINPGSKIQIKLIGNGWRLDYSTKDSELHNVFNEKISKRCRELAKNNNIEFGIIDNSIDKESLAIGASTATKGKIFDIENHEKLFMKTIIGFDYENKFKWSDILPLPINREVNKLEVLDIRNTKTNILKNKNVEYIFSPELVDHYVSSKCFKTFCGFITETTNSDVYGQVQRQKNIILSPLGVLFEIFMDHLADLK